MQRTADLISDQGGLDMRMLRRARKLAAMLALGMVFLGISLSGTLAQAQVSSNGRLIIATLDEPETLDPQKATGIGTVQLAFLLYDSLVSLDYNLRIVPGLAERWQRSADGLSWTFYLRRGVRFHSGKPLVAADVKWTFERRLAKETGSPNAWRIADIDRIETPDDYTVVFHLKKPSRIFLLELAAGFSSILNPQAVQAAGREYGHRVVDGTGPFKLKYWRPGQEIVLERNDAYTWGPPFYSNRGPAYLREVVWKIIPEYTTRLLQLEAGQVDMILRHVPPFEVDRLRRHPYVQVMDYPVLITRFIGFRVDHPAFRDVEVRRAISEAINKRQITQSVYFGLAEPADVPLAPNTYGRWDGKDGVTYTYDPQAAARRLDRAGWRIGPSGVREKDGVRLSGLRLYALPQYRDELSLVQADLKRVGIDIELQLLESSALFPALAKGEHDFYFMNIPYNSADVLYGYFHSEARPAPNRHAWADPETDRLFAIWRTSLDENEALAAIKEVQKIIIENAVWVPMYYPKSLVAVNTRTVRGFKPHPEYDNGSYKLLDTWSVRQ